VGIVFDKRPGEIYDIFLGLWLANNYDYAQEEKKHLGITKDTKFEENLKFISENEKINIQNLERYFYKEAEPHQIFSLEGIWRNPTLEKYLEYLRNVDELKLRKIIIKLIMELDGDEKDAEVEKLTLDNSTALNYVKSTNINVGLKWELFCLLDNKEKYLNDFIKFIYNFVDLYRSLYIERNEEIDAFNKELQKNIKENGVNYLKEFTNNIIDFDNYEEIYVTSSAPTGLSVHIRPEEKLCYVIVGPHTKDIVQNAPNKSETEKYLAVLKNISDGTRFEILKKLVERDYYGLELANNLGLTKATISHHMSFLLFSGIVRVERKNRKSYCSIDKEVIRKTIQFLTKELKL